MGETIRWKNLATLGLICLFQVFLELDIPGPWNSSSFTQGSIALLGLILLYIAWFRYTFGIAGVAPTIDRWNDPVRSSKKVILCGIITLILAFVTGRINVLPEPTGLMLALIGLLMTLCGIYVWAVANGPLQEEE